MKNLKIAAVLIIIWGPLWLSTGAHAAMYKCVHPSGTTYQETPCQGVTKEKRIAIDASPSVEAQIESRRSHLNQDRQLQISNAIRNGVPLIGMSRLELDEAMGYPNSLNVSNYGQGREEQIIYTRPGRTIYVYTKSGLVTAIQNSEAPALPKKQCRSMREISGLEVDRTAIANRSTRRQEEIQTEIEEIRRCNK